MFCFPSFFLLLSSSLFKLLNQRARRTPSPLPPNPEMAHPGADYDPYDGIVSNPNKKKNPLVLVGASENKWSRSVKGVSRRKRPRPRPRPLFCSRLFFSTLPTLSFPHKNDTGTVATAGVLVAGLIAFRQVREREGELARQAERKEEREERERSLFFFFLSPLSTSL